MGAGKLGALALSMVMLVTACATGGPPGAGGSAHPLPPRDAAEEGRLDGGAAGDQAEAVFVKLPTDFAPVRVSATELTAALTTLWLDMPLRMATPMSPARQMRDTLHVSQ